MMGAYCWIRWRWILGWDEDWITWEHWNRMWGL